MPRIVLSTNSTNSVYIGRLNKRASKCNLIFHTYICIWKVEAPQFRTQVAKHLASFSVSGICRLQTADCRLRLLFKPFTEQNSVAPNSQRTANRKQTVVNANQKQTTVKTNRKQSAVCRLQSAVCKCHTRLLSRQTIFKYM